MREQAQLWMNELGPVTPGVEQIVQHVDGSWVLALDDGAAVHAEWFDQPSRLVLSSIVESMPDVDRMQLHEALLSYNLLQHETGGITMGLGGTNVVQQLDFLLQDRTLADFQEALARFDCSAALWRFIVKTPGSLSPESSANAQP